MGEGRAGLEIAMAVDEGLKSELQKHGVYVVPVEWLYNDLKTAGFSVQRVGDCVAPRRAHAAIVEGERAGASV